MIVRKTGTYTLGRFMNILRLVETEFMGDTNPGNYMGPDIDRFGIVKNNSDEVTHTPETEAERKKRKREEEMETTAPSSVKESHRDVLDELLEDPKVQEMLLNMLKNINVDPVHESKSSFTLDELVESVYGDIGAASSKEWGELSSFDAKSVMKAIEVESEHTPNRAVAAKVALAHFKEDPDYYTKLARVEGEKPYVKTS